MTNRDTGLMITNGSVQTKLTMQRAMGASPGCTTTMSRKYACQREMTDWVVTYQIETQNSVGITEFFRGSKDDCVRIYSCFGGGEDDMRRTDPWHVIIGPLSVWEEFLTYNGGGN